jgi:hypothetical protein
MVELSEKITLPAFEPLTLVPDRLFRREAEFKGPAAPADTLLGSFMG